MLSESPQRPAVPVVRSLRSIRFACVKRALISDIHSNLEGFEAVLADIQQQGITEIYCLGDIIGYGPNPRECIDLVMKLRRVPAGQSRPGGAVRSRGLQLRAPSGPSSGPASSWKSPQGDPADNARRWDFLGELPRNRRENGFLFVHGSARNPLNEYVFPEDIYNQRKMEKIFRLIEQHCFQGHTHVPGIFTQSLNFLSPEEVNYEYRLTDEKTMVNVGSVGQPRDGDSAVLLRGAGGRRDPLPPRRVSAGEDDPEDLRHPGTRQFPGRSAARRKVAVADCRARPDVWHEGRGDGP